MSGSGQKRAATVSLEERSEGHRKKRARLPHTCEWILREPAFTSWKAWDQSTAPVLWIHGPAGIGKSFAADYISDDVANDADQSVVLTCLCDASSSPSSVVRTLLDQVIRDRRSSDAAREEATKVIEFVSEEQTVPFSSDYKLWDALIAVVENSGQLTVIIDGLDEVPSSHLAEEGFDLATRLVDLTAVVAGHLRLLVLSRPQVDIHRALNDSPTIQVTAATVQEDMEAFVRSEVSKRSSLDPYKEEIVKEVVRLSEGIFIWASLAVETLAKQPIGSDAKTLLSNLNIPLEDLYRKVLENQSKDLTESQIMIRDAIIQWITSPVRPIQAIEMANIIATEMNIITLDFGRTALEVCGSLVKLEAGLLKPVHHTLRDFLLDAKNPSFLASEGERNLHMAKILLRYLAHPHFGEGFKDQGLDDRPQNYPLAEYASLYWIHHASLGTPDVELQESILSFLSSPNARRWLVGFMPRFFPSSMLPVPPRPAINARFFHLTMLKSQIIQCFDVARRPEVENKLNSWLRVTYEELLERSRSTEVTGSAALLLRIVELAELYTWLPDCKDKASDLWNEAVGTFSSSTGPDCMALCVAARQGLADKLKREGKYAEAQLTLEEVVDTCRANNSSTGGLALFFALDSLGWVMSRQLEWQAASNHLREALEVAQTQFGTQNPYVLRPQLTLAEVLVKLGRHEEADALCKTLEAQLHEHQKQNTRLPRDSITQLNTLAGIYMVQGKYDAARDTYRAVVSDRNKAFGDNHPLTLWAEMQLGIATKEAGDVAEARRILEALLPRQKKVLDPGHRDIITVTNMLDETVHDKGEA